MEDSTASIYPAQKSHGYPSYWTHSSDISLAQNGYTCWQNIRQLLIGCSISWLFVFCSAQQKHKCPEREELQAQIKSTAWSIFLLCNREQPSYLFASNVNKLDTQKTKASLTLKIASCSSGKWGTFSLTCKALTTMLRVQNSIYIWLSWHWPLDRCVYTEDLCK